MNLAERHLPSAELAQAYSEHAPVMTMIPLFARGIAYAERSMAIRRSLGDLWGQGQSCNFHAVALYSSARFEEALVVFADALRLLERTGDRWEANTALWNMALCHHRLGNYAEAVEISRRVYQDGQEIGDTQAKGIAVGCWAKATEGAVPGSIVQEELERGGSPIVVRVGREPANETVGREPANETPEVSEVARLSVRDSGVGIAPEDQGRIFERFERAVPVRHFGGLGLGLWIVRCIVGAMGGTIRVESSPGAGACFIVDLPLRPPAAPEAMERAVREWASGDGAAEASRASG
jgi:hypothetical protein